MTDCYYGAAFFQPSRNAKDSSSSEQQFNEEVEIDDEFAEGFMVFSRRIGVEIELENYRDQLKKYLKATMAQQLFGTNAFEKIINKDDAMIKKVLSLSEND